MPPGDGERGQGGKLTLSLKERGRGQEEGTERGDTEEGWGEDGAREGDSCLRGDIMFFHFPHLAPATQGLVFIWIRVLLSLVFVYLRS